MSNYEFLDSGRGKRLERVGEDVYLRQAPQADYPPGEETLWSAANRCYRKNNNSAWTGDAVDVSPLDNFIFDDLRMEMRLSENGQIGIYPEQEKNWIWLKETISRSPVSLNVFNGFAYTGASSMVCAAAMAHTSGGQVCHLDASKSSVNWARKNRELCGLPENAVRFIVEDITRFLEREIKRSRRYDGMILDPPAFGRAKGGKTWRLKRDMPGLLDLCARLLSDKPAFFLLSCHDPEITKEDLALWTAETAGISVKTVETLDLVLPSKQGRSLKNGIAARWRSL